MAVAGHARRYQNGTALDALYGGALDTGARVALDLGACGVQEAAFFHQHSDGVDWVFVDHPSYHRAGGGPRPGLPVHYVVQVVALNL